MYTKSKYNSRIENAISKLKMQCKHGLIPTEWLKNFYFRKEKKGKASWLNSRHLKQPPLDRIDKIRLSKHLFYKVIKYRLTNTFFSSKHLWYSFIAAIKNGSY